MSQPLLTPTREPKSSLDGHSEQITIPPRIEPDEFSQKLVKEAMTWVGTPFHDQGRLKQVGVDCSHFIDEVFTNIGVVTGGIPNFSTEEDGSILISLLENYRTPDSKGMLFVPFENRSPGDVIAFCDENCREPDKVRHLAFISERTVTTTFIIEAGRKGTVRHRMDGHWNRRTHSVWRYPR